MKTHILVGTYEACMEYCRGNSIESNNAVFVLDDRDSYRTKGTDKNTKVVFLYGYGKLTHDTIQELQLNFKS